MSDFTVIIPARHGSTRLPGKPLRLIAGRPMIAHVVDRAAESGAARVVVATDDRRIAEAAVEAGAEVALTRADHPTGTDRLAEAVELLGLDDDAIIVNLQGDEPLMPASLLRRTADDLVEHADAAIATVAVPVPAAEAVRPDIVKVVMNAKGYALYFSRSVIPHDRDGDDMTPTPWRRHLGLYAYRGGFLRAYPNLPVPPAERLEKLEQLRALHHGYRIHVRELAQAPPAGVDTAEDLETVHRLLSE